MFNNAQQDKALLDCLEQLERAGTVDVELSGVAANDIATSQADIRAMLIQISHEKLMGLIQLGSANIMDDDNPMVSVTRKVDSRGRVTIKRKIRGDKIEALGKLLRLMTYSKASQAT